MGEAAALARIGWTKARLGEFEEAAACCRDSFELSQWPGVAPYLLAGTWADLGYSCEHLGRYEEAAENYEKSLCISHGRRLRTTGGPRNAARVYTFFGRIEEARKATLEAEPLNGSLGILET